VASTTARRLRAKGGKAAGSIGAQGARQVGPSPALPPVTPLANAPSRPNALWADLDPPAALCPPGLRPSAQQVRAETGGLVCGNAEPGQPSGDWKEPSEAVFHYAPISLAVVFFFEVVDKKDSC